MKPNVGDCSSCTSRHFCKHVCPAAEIYINCDQVKQIEEPVGLPDFVSPPDVDASYTYLTKTEREIVMLFGKGLNRSMVCEVFGITRNALRVHLCRIKKKYLEK